MWNRREARDRNNASLRRYTKEHTACRVNLLWGRVTCGMHTEIKVARAGRVRRTDQGRHRPLLQPPVEMWPLCYVPAPALQVHTLPSYRNAPSNYAIQTNFQTLPASYILNTQQQYRAAAAPPPAYHYDFRNVNVRRHFLERRFEFVSFTLIFGYFPLRYVVKDFFLISVY